MKSFFRVIRKPPSVWWMVIQVFFLSGKYRWELLHIPFLDISKKIGGIGVETDRVSVDRKLVHSIAFAVNGVCNRTPWESRCLVRARCAKYLLNKKGLPCTLYMGVKKNSNGELIAHAWLRCGDVYVTGGREAIGFTVTGIFGDCEK